MKPPSEPLHFAVRPYYVPDAMLGAGDIFRWIGATLEGKLRIESIAGEGGFGVVYRGTHLGFQEPIAVKCLKLPVGIAGVSRDQFLEAFNNEARLLRRLCRATTGVVEALDVGAATSPSGAWTPYIVMEWLAGESLEAMLDRTRAASLRPMSLPEAVQLLAPAARAIAVAHELRVAHRDIKPANIFLAQVGHSMTVKVLDFGIAKVLEDNILRSTGSAASDDGLCAFSPQYAAPEQFDPSVDVTGPWTDVFSCALVLLEVCSGRYGLTGDSVPQLYLAACSPTTRPTFSAWGVKASPRAEEALRCALAVKPTDRFRTLGEMWDAFENAMVERDERDERDEPDPRAKKLELMSTELQPSSFSSPAPAATAAPVPRSRRPSTPAGEARMCTLLSFDLGSFEALAEELEPNEARDVLACVVDALTLCIEELGGATCRVTEHALLAAFGAPRAHENDPERAVVAAMRMVEIVRHAGATDARLRQRTFPTRVGVHTGQVVVEITPDGEVRASGEAVQTATRLRERAPDWVVALSQETQRRIDGLFNLEPLEGARTAFQVTGRVHAKSPFPRGDFYGLPTQVVGRDNEVRTIHDALDAACGDRDCHVLTIAGGAGLGRTRLLRESVSLLSKHPKSFFMLAAAARELESGTAFAFVRSLLLSRIGANEDSSTDEFCDGAAQSLRTWLSENAPDNAALVDEARDDIRLLAEVVVAQEGDSISRRARSQDAPNTRQRVAGALARVFERIFPSAPVVFLCDDLQWADDASLELIEQLMIRVADRPFLLIGTARPEFLVQRPHWGSAAARRSRIELGPLRASQVEAMARDRLRESDEIPASLVTMLVEGASGSPFILAETLDYLVDQGGIEHRTSGPWTIHAERLPTRALPDTVRGLMQARLDHLEPVEREVLVHASVFGDAFWESGLVRLRPPLLAATALGAGSPVSPVSAVLAKLRERRIVRMREPSTVTGQGEYSFAEPAMREAAHQTLSPRSRRAHARAAAEWLAEHVTNDAKAAVFGRLYEMAEDWPRAFVSYARAAANAASLGQNTEALAHYRSAMKSTSGVTPGEQVRVLLELGDVSRRLGRNDEAVDAYEKARALVPDDSRALWLARIDLRYAASHRTRGQNEEARACAERALENARAAAALEEMAIAYALLAHVARRDGDNAGCEATARRGLATCRSISEHDARWREVVADLLMVLGSSFLFRERWPRAERCYHQAIRIAQVLTHSHVPAFAFNDLAVIRYLQGDLTRALPLFARSLELKERGGDLYQVAIALNNVAEVSLRLGDTARATQSAMRAIALGEKVRAYADLPDIYRNHAEASAASGNHIEAIASANRALELAVEHGAEVYLPDVVVSGARIGVGVIRSATDVELRRRATKLLAGVGRCARERAERASAPKFDEALAILASIDIANTAASAT